MIKSVMIVTTVCLKVKTISLKFPAGSLGGGQCPPTSVAPMAPLDLSDSARKRSTVLSHLQSFRCCQRPHTQALRVSKTSLPALSKHPAKRRLAGQALCGGGQRSWKISQAASKAAVHTKDNEPLFLQCRAGMRILPHMMPSTICCHFFLINAASAVGIFHVG